MPLAHPHNHVFWYQQEEILDGSGSNLVEAVQSRTLQWYRQLLANFSPAEQYLLMAPRALALTRARDKMGLYSSWRDLPLFQHGGVTAKDGRFHNQALAA